jgi:hypothetical protein
MASTSTDLEALVGHLFVVGGRAISSPSPGAAATPPPRRAARGRDADTLFCLISLAPGEHRPAAFYEDLVDELTTVYFKTGGSVTTALRKAIDAGNRRMLIQNKSQSVPLEVGLAGAVLRQDELYLALTGPGCCFLVHEGNVEQLPAEEEWMTDSIGLGVEDEPDVRYYHRDVEADDFLLLADATFERLTEQALTHAVATGKVDDALANLVSVASDYAACEVIQFVAPLDEGESDTLPAPKQRRVPPLPQFGRAADRQADEAPAIPEMEAAAGARAPALEPGAEGDERVDPAAPPLSARQRAQRAGQNTALGLARLTERVRLLVERWLPDETVENPLAQRLQLSLTMQIGVVVAVAVLAALLTAAVYRLRGQTRQYAQFVREAQAEVELAREGGSQAAARPHWENAVFLLDQAAELRAPGSETADLREEALAALDDYDHVTRVTPSLLRGYPPGAYLRGPIIHGLNLYVLDTTNDVLYREDLNDEGTAFVNREPQAVTQKGELVGNQVIGGMVDLVWMEDGGVQQRNVLAVLSRNGLLITYSPSFDATATLLPGAEAWQDPRAIAVYERDLYVLDAGANEIWRYAASANAYASAPQRYFTDIVPELTDAVDMEIDSNGNVYVLHSGGSISKYFFGRPESFQFEGLPQPLARPTALFLNLSLYDRTLFVADPGGGRLYTLAPNGAMFANYKDADDTIFDALSGVFNLDRPPFVYVTAGNNLYYFSRP